MNSYKTCQEQKHCTKKLKIFIPQKKGHCSICYTKANRTFPFAATTKKTTATTKYLCEQANMSS